MAEITIFTILQWAGYLAFGLLTGFGTAKLMSARQQRKYKLEDKKQAKIDADHNEMQAKVDAAGVLAEGNNAVRVTADGNLIAILIKRIELLEQDVREMQKEQVSQAGRNATLTTQNENLEKENSRQAGEIGKLRDRNRYLDEKVNKLTAVVTKLEQKIAELTGMVPAHPVTVTIVDSEGVPADAHNPLNVQVVEGEL